MYLHIAALSLSEIFGFCSLCRYSKTKEARYIALALLGYAGLVLFLLMLLRSKTLNLLKLNVTWQISALIMGSVATWVFFGERLEHPVQYLGVILGLVSIMLVNYVPK
jgi:multidrug transporter EmrE-like cation transporter